MTFSVRQTDFNCNQCQHFGGWIPTTIDGRRRWVHGWCLHGHQVIARPLAGCAYWVQVEPAREAPIVWTSTTSTSTSGTRRPSVGPPIHYP